MADDMGGAVRFRKGMLEEIHARAAASPHEVCGLLLGKGAQVLELLHCSNVSPDPATAFEVDPAQLIAAHKAARAGAPAILGCYHSHPSGDPQPSLRDAAAAAPDGWLWLIVAGQGAALFRAVPDGDLHGRFTAMTYAV